MVQHIGRRVHDLGPAGGRHDAGGHRLLEAEGTADGHDPFADGDVIGIAEGHRGEAAAILDLQHGDVRAGIGADKVGVVLVTFDGHHVLASTGDDVVVGDDVAILREDNA